MALINCPECNHEISDTVQACPHCGYDLSKDKKIIWPECNQEISENMNVCPSCGFVFSVVEKPQEKGRVGTTLLKLPKYAFYIGIIISIALFVIGITRVKNEDYSFYSNHKQECIAAQDDVKSALYTSGYLFTSTYEMLIDDYDDMIKADNKKLNAYRAQAIILCVLGAFCGIVSIYSIKKKGEKDGTN